MIKGEIIYISSLHTKYEYQKSYSILDLADICKKNTCQLTSFNVIGGGALGKDTFASLFQVRKSIMVIDHLVV